MSPSGRVALAVACALLACCSAQSDTPGAAAEAPAAAAVPPAPAAAPAPATLACDGGTFSAFRLKNTGARTYEPGGFAAGRNCTLTDEAEGVIWVATGEGLALGGAEEKLTFKDDQGRLLEHTCWTSSGTINDVTQTELILVGAVDIKTIQVCCGEACAGATLEGATEGGDQ